MEINFDLNSIAAILGGIAAIIAAWKANSTHNIVANGYKDAIGKAHLLELLAAQGVKGTQTANTELKQ